MLRGALNTHPFSQGYARISGRPHVQSQVLLTPELGSNLVQYFVFLFKQDKFWTPRIGRGTEKVCRVLETLGSVQDRSQSRRHSDGMGWPWLNLEGWTRLAWPGAGWACRVFPAEGPA